VAKQKSKAEEKDLSPIEASEPSPEVEGEMREVVKFSVKFLIQSMCKDCPVNTCLECLYLSEALKGELDGVHEYLEVMSKFKLR